jgi:hypothetical protein
MHYVPARQTPVPVRSRRGEKLCQREGQEHAAAVA